MENRYLLAVDILQTALTGNEGDTFEINVSFSGETSINLDWGDGSTVETIPIEDINGRGGSGTRQLTHRYLDDNPTGTSSDVYTITATGITVDTATATVNNVAPTVSLSAVLAGTTSRLTGTILDPGSLDTFTLDLDWGDESSTNNTQVFTLGTSPLTESTHGINWNPTTRTFSLSHLHSSSGSFTISATVTDDDGSADTESFTVTATVPIVLLSASPTVNEGDTGSITASLFFPDTSPGSEGGTVLVPFPATENVTVSLEFSGTAAEGVDYTVPDTIVILAGTSSASVAVTTEDDGTEDPDETIVVDITNVVGADEGTTEEPDQQATITIVEQQFTEVANPVVRLNVTPGAISEVGGVARITVRLIDPNPPAGTPAGPVKSGEDVTVFLDFSGVAANGSDYTLSGVVVDAENDTISIVIPAGFHSASATITAIDDNGGAEPVVDPVESVIVAIASVENGAEDGVQAASTLIVEPGALAVVLRIDNTSIAESSGVATVTATLVDPLTGPGGEFPAFATADVTVSLAFTGTAIAADYNVSDTSILIPAGSSSGFMTITALQDNDSEGSETVVVDINGVTSDASVVELGQQQVTTTIIDDDLPVVVLSALPLMIAEPGGQSIITATLFDQATRAPLTEGINLAVTVDLSFAGIAMFGTDYTASSTQIEIPAGSVSGFTTITAVDDPDVEGSESVFVRILSVTNANASLSELPTIFIVDDESTTLDFFAEAGGPYTVDEGGSVQVSATGSIVSAGSIYEWDLNGNGVFGEAGETGITPTFSAAGKDGPTSIPVQLRITSADGTREAFDSAIVNVINVAPTIGAINLSQSSINEGQSVTVTGSFTDPAFGVVTETFTGSALWSDGIFTAVTITGNSFSTTRSFPDDHPFTGTASDTFTVDITITDDDTGTDTETSPVLTVNNVAPTIGPISLSAASIDEGQSVTVTGSFTDPALGVSTETFTGSAVWSDGVSTALTINADGSFSTSRDFPDDHPSTGTAFDTFTVVITIADDDTGSDAETSPTLTVNNVAPTITSITNSSPGCGGTLEGHAISVLATFSDPGFTASETFTATVDWGDGTTSSSTALPPTVTVSPSSGGASTPTVGTVSASHTYLNGGIYRIVVKVFDDDGGAVAATTTTMLVGAGIQNGVLNVIGTNNADQSTQNEQGNGLIKIHGTFFEFVNFKTFPASAVKLVNFVLCGGDDKFNLAGNIGRRIVVDGGPGHDTINVHASNHVHDREVENWATAPATNLGVIDNVTVPNLNPGADGNQWFQFQATNTGTLAIEALFNASQGESHFVLMDANRNVVGGSMAISGGERLDTTAVVGETFFLVVLGANSDVDVTIQNVVTFNSPLTVHGTSGDDTFEFGGGDVLSLKVNGIKYYFDPATVTSVNFVGNGGSDSIVLSTKSGSDAPTLLANGVDLVGGNYVAHVRDVNSIQLLLGQFGPLLHNAANALDVDGTGTLTVLDIFQTIAWLRNNGSQTVAHVLTNSLPGTVTLFYNANADSAISPLDVFTLIAALRNAPRPLAVGSDEGSSASSGAEGEGFSDTVTAPPVNQLSAAPKSDKSGTSDNTPAAAVMGSSLLTSPAATVNLIVGAAPANGDHDGISPQSVTSTSVSSLSNSPPAAAGVADETAVDAWFAQNGGPDQDGEGVAGESTAENPLLVGLDNALLEELAGSVGANGRY